MLVSGSSAVAAPAKPTVLTDLPPWTTSTEATFQFSSSGSATGFVCRLDSNAAGGVPCTSPTSYSSLAQGDHVFQVRALDSSGDTSPPTTFDWTIDITAPVLPPNIVAEAVFDALGLQP